MFTCTACLRRCTSLLTADVPPLTLTSPLFFSNRPISRLRSVPSPSATSANVTTRRSLRRPNATFIRTAVTFRGLGKPHHVRDGVQTLRKANSLNALAQAPARNALAQSRRNSVDAAAVESNAITLATDKGKLGLQRQAEKEAEFLVDPLRLAETVIVHLRKDDFEKAHSLVLASDRVGLRRGIPQGSVRNVVSWNHLIDWTMGKREYTRAMQLYQDMKKRGHVPDSHTYLHVLRGLREGVKVADGARLGVVSKGLRGMSDRGGNKQLVTQALEVYNSMFRPNSQVKAETIHSNALIDLLARAGDMDALWGVAGRLPEKGPGSADHWTYTTILNAMRQDLLFKMKSVNDGKLSREEVETQLNAVVESAMFDARQLWRDVVIRWRNALINMDEKLVSAMARLLLATKKPAYVRDIFALVRQTMGVESDEWPVYRIEKELRTSTASSLKAANPIEDDIDGEAAREVSEAEETHDDPYVGNENSSQAVSLFEPIPRLYAGKQRKSLYATPSNNTLSFVLDAATLLRQPAIGKAFWTTLTSETALDKGETISGPDPIVPDSTNLMDYLRLLRLSRSSKEALKVLQTDWKGDAENIMNRRGTFVIAMSTCVRDKNNPRAFEIASKMLDLMQSHAHNLEASRDEEAHNEEVSRGKLPPGMRKPVRALAPMEALPLDPKILQMYLSLAAHTTKGINSELPLTKLPTGDLDYERDPRRNNTMRALARLRPDIINTRRLLDIALAQIEHRKALKHLPAKLGRLRPKPRAETAEQPEELLSLLQTIVSTYDKVLVVDLRLEEEGAGTIGERTITEMRWQKGKITEYIRRIKKAMQGHLNEDAIEQTRARYDPAARSRVPAVEVGHERQEEEIAEQASQPVSEEPRVRYSNTISGRPPSLTSREAQYTHHSQNFDQFKEYLEQARRDNKPISRRQQKFMNWMEANGKLSGPQPNLRKEVRTSRDSMTVPEESSAPVPVKGLGVVDDARNLESLSEDSFQETSKIPGNHMNRSDDRGLAPSHHSSASDETYRDEDLPSRALKSLLHTSEALRAAGTTGINRRGVAPKRLSKRQTREGEREEREDAIRRQMVRLGANEKTVRRYRAGARAHAASTDTGRRPKWTPSQQSLDVGDMPSAATTAAAQSG